MELLVQIGETCFLSFPSNKQQNQEGQEHNLNEMAADNEHPGRVRPMEIK